MLAEIWLALGFQFITAYLAFQTGHAMATGEIHVADWIVQRFERRALREKRAGEMVPAGGAEVVPVEHST